MIRNFKALGLALVAAFAMSAVAASAASAESPFHFGSTVDHTVLSGTQVSEDVFTVHGGTVKCSSATYTGTINSSTTKTTEVTITPAYGGCRFAGIAESATIDMNSCDYLFTAKTTDAGPVYTGEVHIKCTTPGDTITVTVVIGGVTKCIVHIPEQSLTGITYSNAGAPSHIHVNVNIAGIHYSQTEGTGGGKCETKDNTTTGTYVGTATLKGFDTENHQVGISVTKTV